MISLVLFAFQCLPDPNNYHEFCRLLARLKSNYQLGELVKVENYPEVIRLIANFTVTSLQVSVGSQASKNENSSLGVLTACPSHLSRTFFLTRCLDTKYASTDFLKQELCAISTLVKCFLGYLPSHS